MTRSHALAPALLLALAACTPDFEPASRIEKLRVLAIRAEPPEIDPDGVRTSSLTSLVLRPELDAEPVRTTTVVHLACVPAGGETRPSACAMLGALADPAAVLDQLAAAACAGGGGGGLDLVPPVLAGVEACARGACGPATLAGGAVLPPPAVSVGASHFAAASGTEKILGTEATVLAFALDATPDEVAAPGAGPCPDGDLAARLAALWRTREHVLSAKRVRVRGPASPDEAANRNPAVDGVVAGGVPLADPGALTTLAPGDVHLAPLRPSGAAGEPETYTKLDASGLVVEAGAREEWVYSWFSTAGALDELHTRGAETNRWTGLAPGARARVAIVLRDLRGGTAWAVREVAVAP